MPKGSLAAISLVLLFTLLSGCGMTKKVEDRVGEKLAESAIEKATGIKVDTGNEKITVTGQDGKQTELTTAPEGKVPASFPLPVLPGFTTDGFVETKSDGKMGWIGSFNFKGDVKQTAETYHKELEKLGFEVSFMGMDGEGIFMVEGKVNGKQYGGMITFGKLEDGLGEVAVLFGESGEQ